MRIDGAKVDSGDALLFFHRMKPDFETNLLWTADPGGDFVATLA